MFDERYDLKLERIDLAAVCFSGIIAKAFCKAVTLSPQRLAS